MTMKSHMRYAGIGSRQTPAEILRGMQVMAAELANDGWGLRTGGADGADSAFEAGHRLATGESHLEVYVPWYGYNERWHGIEFKNAGIEADAKTMAANAHPAWGRCSQGARKLHARNVEIILGTDLREPVDAVVCWTPDGEASGGTGLGIRLAERYGIPVFNLATTPADEVMSTLRSLAAATHGDPAAEAAGTEQAAAV